MQLVDLILCILPKYRIDYNINKHSWKNPRNLNAMAYFAIFCALREDQFAR
jgi:hypothetical protein